MSNEALVELIERLLQNIDQSLHPDLLRLVNKIITLQRENTSLWESWKQSVGKQ